MKFRATTTPRLSLELSGQLLLTLKPFSSKLPTHTRLPLAVCRFCLSSSFFTGNRALLPALLKKELDYMLFFLNFIWEYSNYKFEISAKNKQEVQSPPKLHTTDLNQESVFWQIKTRYPARLNRSRANISRITLIYTILLIKQKSPDGESPKGGQPSRLLGFKRDKLAKSKLLVTSGQRPHRD